MEYRILGKTGLRISRFGFGGIPIQRIDAEGTKELIHYLHDAGVNYIDTAYPYHGGMSERVMGKILSQYPRESYFLADKFPGHMILESYDPQTLFEEQLRRCNVDYFDFYLLHNVYEESVDRYLDPQWGILEYLKEQKRNGRIRHLGFSTHGRLDMMEKFLAEHGEDMEFCQIQLNYLDWTLQEAKEKYELLSRYNIPVWVMEPVRGGKLANFQDPRLLVRRPDATTASWGFRFLQGLPNVKMILSGMSNMDHMTDNVETFAQRQPLNQEETDLLFQIAEEMKNVIPCTGCRYCCDGCPMELDIPAMMSICSDIRFAPVVNSVMMLEGLPDNKKPSACIACGKCTKVCPQGIDIPAVMKELAHRIEEMPKWAEICRQRELERKNSKEM